jgi:hypothetical protein
VRHCIEALLQRLDRDVIAPADLPWAERVRRLVHNTCDPAQADLPVFDHEMLMLEHRVAEPKNHRRVFDELVAKWLQAFAACRPARVAGPRDGRDPAERRLGRPALPAAV